MKIKIYLVITLTCFSLPMFSQGNLPYRDDKFFHFGFSLGTNLMDFGITQKDTVIGGKVYDPNVSTLQPGFSVGIITDFRLHRYLNARFTPTLHFGERNLTYRARDEKTGLYSDTVVNPIPSIPIVLPIYLKYSAERYNNFRPYLIGGGGAYIDLGTDKEKPVLLRPFDVFAEIGVGCDIYFSFFKLAPELKFGLGFTDLLVPLDKRTGGTVSDNDKKYSDVLSKLTSRMLTLTFNFE
jgi:hypothetical protein